MITKKQNNTKYTSMKIAPFTREERESVIKARKLSGLDIPTLYHNCIMAQVAEINKEAVNASRE